ncbi:MAG: LTA synthase family protein [Mobilitalea sp.]
MKIFNKDIKFSIIKDNIFKKKNKVKYKKMSGKIMDYDEDPNSEMDEWLEPDLPLAKTNKIKSVIGKYSLLFYMIVAIIINFMIETISRHSFVEAYNFFIERSHVVLYNSFIIFVTLTLTYLFRKRIFAFLVISGVWLTGGIANGVILTYRVTPFTGTDLKLIGSAAEVATKYLSIDQIILAAIAAVAVICFLVYMGHRSAKYTGKMRYRRNILLIVLLFLSIIPVTQLSVKTNVLSTYFGNIVIAYEDYGFPYCFWCTVIAKGIDCPNNYDEKTVKKILNRDGEDSYNIDKTPNIIIVQLESFFDPESIKALELSEDPIPNFRRLEKYYTSGYITVPVVGAGTANTEFEVITGMSLRYFGPGEYPYKTILTDNVCESVAYNLKGIGYATHAIHNNVADFYGRDAVFAKLGFDTFTSEEMMNITEYTPLGWAKDEVLTSTVMDCLKSTEGQDFIYTITVQSHGGYQNEQPHEDMKISVNGTVNEEESNPVEYYVNQLNEVDEFIGALVEELSNYEEDTILVLFGDHQPSLDLQAKDLTNGSIYQTEYVIWDNMGLKASDKNIKSYQLAAIALDKAGIHVGTLMKYHQVRMGTRNYALNLDVLQYDMLYGDKYVYGGESLLEETVLQMGVKNIIITEVTNELTGNVTLKGENFNSFSKAKINEEDVETIYVDENTLTLVESTIKYGDILEVDIVSSDDKILRKGIAITYNSFY